MGSVGLRIGLLMLNQNLFHFSLELFARDHDAVGTALALNSDVHPHSNDLPAVRTAWMRLFHFDHVIQAKFFIRQHCSPL